MTTDLMEVYSLEEGDQILIGENVYKILEIFDGIDCDYAMHLVDEEGYRRTIEVDSEKKLRLVIDNYAEV
jgi:hypothetical protein